MKKIFAALTVLVAGLVFSLASCADTNLALTNADTVAILSSASNSIYAQSALAALGSSRALAAGSTFTVTGASGGSITVTCSLSDNGELVYGSTFNGFATSCNGAVYDLSGTMSMTYTYRLESLIPFVFSLGLTQTGVTTISKEAASLDVNYNLSTTASITGTGGSFTSSGTINGQSVTGITGTF